MQGKVTLINQATGMAALFTEQGRFVLLHYPRGALVALHDVLLGEMGSNGYTTLHSEGCQQSLTVRVICCDCSLMAAKKALGVLAPPVSDAPRCHGAMEAHIPA